MPSELQSNIVVKDNIASGTLHYIKGWTEFSSKASEQQGNYIALKLNDVPKDAIVTYKAKGSTKAPVTLDSDRNIVIICTNKPSMILEFTIKDGDTTVVKEVSLANITFEKDGD